MFPGAIGTELRRYEEIGPFCNTGNSTVCASVEFDSGTCVESSTNFVLVIPVAYTEFNPANISDTYLGTIGNDSPNFFQFDVEADSSFFVIGTQVRGIDSPQGDGSGCSFSVLVKFDGEQCGGGFN